MHLPVIHSSIASAPGTMDIEKLFKAACTDRVGDHLKLPKVGLDIQKTVGSNHDKDEGLPKYLYNWEHCKISSFLFPPYRRNNKKMVSEVA